MTVRHKRLYLWCTIGGVAVGMLFVMLLFPSNRLIVSRWLMTVPGVSGMSINPMEDGWRVLDLSRDGDQFRILAKLEAGKVPRLKLEHVVDANIYLLCEYVNSEHGSFAQRFNPQTGMAVAYLNPALFARVYDDIQVQKNLPGRDEWTLPASRRSGVDNDFNKLLQICSP